MRAPVHSSGWYLLSACCQYPRRILVLQTPLGNVQVFEIANSFLAKLDFDWKERQCCLCTDEASASSGITSGSELWWSRKACPPPWLGLCVPAALPSKTAVVLKACFESLQFRGSWGLELPPSREVLLWNGAEHQAASTTQELTGSLKDKSWSTWLSFRLKFYFFIFSLKVKENTQNRERGIHSWLGFLTRCFWPCEWYKSFSSPL